MVAEPITTRPITSLLVESGLASATDMTNRTLCRRSGGTSNIIHSLYTGLVSCFLVDVFFFLTFLPSNKRTTLMNGSVNTQKHSSVALQSSSYDSSLEVLKSCHKNKITCTHKKKAGTCSREMLQRQNHVWFTYRGHVAGTCNGGV